VVNEENMNDVAKDLRGWATVIDGKP
jgi:hypothetical protein